MPDLARSLADYDGAMLKAIALSRGLETGDSRAELLEAILSEALSPLAVRLLWQRLHEDERRALEELAAKGGSLRAVHVEHDYGEVRHFGFGRLVRERLWENPANTTESLYFLGLIFRGFEQSGAAAIWYVPADLLSLLPLPSPQPVPEAIESLLLEAEVEPARAADDFLPRAVLHILVAARADDGRPVEAAARRLAIEADAPDEERSAYFARLALALAQEAGLVEGQRLSPRVAERARRWLRLPRARAVAAVGATWLTAAGWHELLQAPGIAFEGGRLPEAKPARRRLCQVLAGLASGPWYRVRDLQLWLLRNEPDFLRRDADFDSLYLRDSESGAPLDGIAAWMQVEGRFADEVLVTLNALTAISLGTYDDARCFRLEPGAFWLRGEPSPAVAEGLALRLLPGLEVSCASDARYFTCYQIERLAEPLRAAGRWRFSRGSLRQALRAGLELERMLAFLQSHVAGFDTEARRDVEALVAPPTIETAPRVLLSTSDPEGLAAVMDDPAMAIFRLELLPDGRLLVPAAVWPAVEARLRQRGYQVQRADGQERPSQTQRVTS